MGGKSYWRPNLLQPHIVRLDCWLLLLGNSFEGETKLKVQICPKEHSSDTGATGFHTEVVTAHSQNWLVEEKLIAVNLATDLLN